MEDKLKNLRKDMDETVLKKGEVSEEEKERIYYKVIHSRSSKRKTRRFVPALSIVTCLLLILILGSTSFSDFFSTEQSTEKEDFNQSDESVGDDENESEKKLENEQAEFDKRKFPDEHYQKIYDYLLEWELPEENRVIAEESEVKYENGFSFSKDTGYISSIDLGEGSTDVSERPLPTEEQYMGVVMGSIHAMASELEDKPTPSGTTHFNDEKGNFTLAVNDDGIKVIYTQSSLIRDRMELALNYSDELPALKSEIDKFYTNAENLASESASMEDDNVEKAKELEQQYVLLKRSIVNLAGIIDLAREDKLNEQSY
ncbi:hypothetical protein [Pseudalkalibacillus hwajinpoensis]|uniref:hypothetical protein n=1 Tax=Guptibacillus hwajinpoensis TaxID=208199 RepID=UPI001CD3C5BD|nr:hypothetical protein [Pseudalkalibacillus hwajinpoensis]MCA0991460.1 hypothetical protein [Pseudalkalibacillus hwajinpoensis]